MYRTPAIKNKMDQAEVTEERAGLSPTASQSEQNLADKTQSTEISTQQQRNKTPPPRNLPVTRPEIQTPVKQQQLPKIKPPVKTNIVTKKVVTAVETPSPVKSPREAKEFYPNKAAEARDVYRKGVENLERFKNLKTSVKVEIRKSLDRLYALANGGPAVRNLGKEIDDDTPPTVMAQTGVFEKENPNSKLEKILLEHSVMLSENMKTMSELRITIEKVEGIKKVIDEHNEAMTKATYANVVTTGSTIRTTNERTALHSVVVSSRNEQDTGEEVLEKVRKAIDAKEGWIRVEKVRKAKDRKIVVGCATEEERRKIKERIEKTDERLVVETMKNKNPLLVLKNVISKHSDEEILKALRNQNREIFQGLDHEKDQMIVKYRKKARNPHTNHIVLTVSPIIWRRAVDTGKLRIDLQSVYVEDQSPLVQCSRCLGYGHGRRYCKETEDLCSHCSGPHFSTKCPDKALGEPPTCVNCKRAKMENPGHHAFSHECLVRKKWDAVARATVSYC